MPSTAKTLADIGFIDPAAATNQQRNQWFKDAVLGNISAYNKALAEYNAQPVAGAAGGGLGTGIGGGIATGLGTDNTVGPPTAPKYYNWLTNEILKQHGGKGATDPLAVWKSMTAAEKDKIILEVGAKAMKDENSGSFLGNLLIKPTMPLTFISPFNAIPGAVGTVATVGLTSAGGVGTILTNPVIGELGTGIVTAASGAGTIATGGGKGGKGEEVPPDEEEEKPPNVSGGGTTSTPGVSPTPTVAPDRDDPRPPVVLPPTFTPPGVEPGSVPDDDPEEDPPVIVPPDEPEEETPDFDPGDVFGAAIGNMGLFHGQAGISRKPYTPVEAPQQAGIQPIRHSAPVQAMMGESGQNAPRRTAQAPAVGLGLGTDPAADSAAPGGSGGQSALERLRARRRGLGIG